MTSITTTPTLVAPKRPAQVTITLSESDPDDRPANFVRVWGTVAPPGSEIDGLLNKSADPRNRVVVYEGNGGSAFPWKRTFDLGGKYTFVAQEYVRGGSGGPAFQDDSNAFDNETKAGSETTLALYVGQRVTQPIGPPQDRAELVLWVWNDTIRATTVSEGEESPAIVSTGTPTPGVATAINAASVLAALDALDGVAVAVALGTPSALISNFVTQWNEHLGEGPGQSIHAAADADNLIPVGLASASTPKNFQRFVNEALKYMRRHFTNDNGEEGIDSAGYHAVTVSVNDWPNMPLYEGAGGHAEAIGAFADLHRCHSAHRLSVEPAPGVHQDVDGFALTALPALFAVHSAFLAVLASSSPTAPPAQSSGVQTLVSGAGFSEG